MYWAAWCACGSGGGRDEVERCAAIVRDGKSEGMMNDDSIEGRLLSTSIVLTIVLTLSLLQLWGGGWVLGVGVNNKHKQHAMCQGQGEGEDRVARRPQSLLARACAIEGSMVERCVFHFTIPRWPRHHGQSQPCWMEAHTRLTRFRCRQEIF